MTNSPGGVVDPAHVADLTFAFWKAFQDIFEVSAGSMIDATVFAGLESANLTIGTAKFIDHWNA